MAGVWVRGSTVWVSFGSGPGRRRFPLRGQSTSQENIKRLARERDRIVARSDDGESLDDLIAEWLGTRKQAQTLGYYAQHFLDIVAPKRRGVKLSTLRDYESAYNAHWLVWDSTPIDRLPMTEMERTLDTKGLSMKRQRNVVSVLRMIVDCAVRDGAIDRNLVWDLPRSKHEPEPDPDPYTKAERDQLLDWLANNSEIAWRYFLQGFYMGMRTGELLGAPWAAYSPPVMSVHQEMVRRDIRPYTKTQAREVPVPKVVQDMLKDNPTRFRRDLIHMTPQGRMFRDADWLMKWWNRAHEATGTRRRAGPYPWRSTYISLNVSAGVPMETVALWAGNSVDMIRRHYFRYLPDQERDTRHHKLMEEALK